MESIYLNQRTKEKGVVIAKLDEEKVIFKIEEYFYYQISIIPGSVDEPTLFYCIRHKNLEELCLHLQKLEDPAYREFNESTRDVTGAIYKLVIEIPPNEFIEETQIIEETHSNIENLNYSKNEFLKHLSKELPLPKVRITCEPTFVKDMYNEVDSSELEKRLGTFISNDEIIAIVEARESLNSFDMCPECLGFVCSCS